MMPGSSRGSQLCPFIRLPSKQEKGLLRWELNYPMIKTRLVCVLCLVKLGLIFHKPCFYKVQPEPVYNCEELSESSVLHTTELLGLFAAGTRFSWLRGVKQPGTAALFFLSQAIPGRTPACASEATCLLTEKKVLYLLHHLAGSGLIEGTMTAYIQPQKANIDRAGQRTHLQTIPHPALCVCESSPVWLLGCQKVWIFPGLLCGSVWEFVGRKESALFLVALKRKTVKSALNCSEGQTEERWRQTQPDLTQLTGGFSELSAVKNDITVPNSQHKGAHNITTWMYTLNLDQASLIRWFPLVLLLQISFYVVLHILMISLRNFSEELVPSFGCHATAFRIGAISEDKYGFSIFQVLPYSCTMVFTW